MVAIGAFVALAIALVLHLIKADAYVVWAFGFGGLALIALHCVWPLSLWSSTGPGRRRAP